MIITAKINASTTVNGTTITAYWNVCSKEVKKVSLWKSSIKLSIPANLIPENPETRFHSVNPSKKEQMIGKNRKMTNPIKLGSRKHQPMSVLLRLLLLATSLFKLVIS